jgi:hypothetical protein
MEQLQRSDGNYTVTMEVVTVDWSHQHSDRSSRERLRVLIDFGEHARELISAEVGLRLLELLASEQQLITQLTSDFSADGAHQVMALLNCCLTLQVCSHAFRAIVMQRAAISVTDYSAWDLAY